MTTVAVVRSTIATGTLIDWARRGEISNFTGIDDPYEAPQHPEIWLDTVQQSARGNARLVLDYLIEERYVRVPHDQDAPSIDD